MKYASTPTGDWLPLDHIYWRHEADAIRLKHELQKLGWAFWD